ncbi:hypothetical protein NN561_002755 [Cricetulus griseus]
MPCSEMDAGRFGSERGGRKQCPACYAWGNEHPAGVPYLPNTHTHALGCCGSAYLDDAAASGGRSCSLQEAGLAVPGGSRSAWQCDPAATVPHPATRDRGCSVPGGSVGGDSGVVFASGSVERRRTLPASRALSHGQARFGDSRRDSTTDTGCPAPGTGALGHREEAPLDFVSAPDGGCSSSRNFVERRHRGGRGVLGLWSRRSAGRRRGRGEDASGREKQEKSSGRYRRRRDANARSAQTKGGGRPARSLRSWDARRRRSGDCRRVTRHLPADRGAAAPGSAAAAAASTPLACDTEGRLVLTARRDWQAPGPLRSRGSPGGFGSTNPHCGGVCPEREEWNVFWSSLPARPRSPARY